MNLKDLSGHVCVVTGANSGIGKETCTGLVRQGARVAMVCRSEERGRKAQEDVESEAASYDGITPGTTDLLLADLAVQEEVRALGDEITERYDRLDVLVNNAGLFNGKREVTDDGVEKTFAVNHLAPFLLTHRVADLLKQTAEAEGEARIVNVGSEAHRGVRINFDDVNAEEEYSGLQAYGQSKLANVLFTHELSRRLHDSGVLANCVHPGVVATHIWRGADWLSRIGRLFKWFYKSPAEGAEPVLYVAASPELGDVTGQYFKEMKRVNPSPAAFDEKTAARLWRLSRELTGLHESTEEEEL
jgi:NAD(P)-dependent dehydrogenase (short-subunit alcohol dehydrogenase family)